MQDGFTTEQQWIKELEQQNRELRRANDLLKRASAFLWGGTRPPREVIGDVIDDDRAEFGVEFICRQMQVACVQLLRGQEATGRAVDPGRP